MKQDVASYYNQTQNHYKRWWQLDRSMALHYGLWFNDTRNFTQALENTNEHLAALGNISKDEQILDAGCGVGGSSIYLAKKYNVEVIGITLSELQVNTARKNAQKHNVSNQTEFIVSDFTQTTFDDNKFDLVWACESSSSAADKDAFARECYRVLKPGGRMVLADFFRTESNDSQNLLEKWTDLWAMSPLVTARIFTKKLEETGFEVKKESNMTSHIHKTAKKMYQAYLLGAIPSILYNLFFGARKYSKYHYRSGLYQYISLKKGLWEYRVILTTKPE